MALSPCNNTSSLRRPRLAPGVALAAALALAGCVVAPEKPAPTAEAGAEQQTGLSDAQRAEFSRGATALSAGNSQLAAQIFSTLATNNPQLAAAQVNLGIALMMEGRDDDARAAFERAVALDAALPTAQLRLGVLYRRAGAFDKAEAAYLAALAAAPDNRYAHLNLGILYDVYLGRPAVALPHYERFQALSDQPDKEVAIWITDIKQRL